MEFTENGEAIPENESRIGGITPYNFPKGDQMPRGINKEKYFKMLRESAAQRYGEEQAKLLEPAIQEMAQSLEVIAEYPLEKEEEPAFFS